MNVEKAREYCLSKKGATECLPFDEYSLVIKVLDKMFAVIDLESANKISLKCDPERAVELRERFNAVEGAWHFNKKYWNMVSFDSDADDRMIESMIDHSYDEVVKKLPRKRQNELSEMT